MKTPRERELEEQLRQVEEDLWEAIGKSDYADREWGLVQRTFLRLRAARLLRVEPPQPAREPLRSAPAVASFSANPYEREPDDVRAIHAEMGWLSLGEVK